MASGAASGAAREAGVYLFRGSKDEVLYVGKAKSLRSRVRSYFQKPATRGPVGSAARADPPHRGDRHEHEVEALHLEQNLVKRTGRRSTSASATTSRSRTSRSRSRTSTRG
jgi:excinuclease UvrABC nuclease subunit